jgi:oligogalacturonide lyase
MNKPLSLLLALVCAGPAVRADYPSSWIDPDTGHRIVQLSREAGTQSLYFTQNAYTRDGRLIVQTPHGLATIDVGTGDMTAIPDPAPTVAPAQDQPAADGSARFRNRMRLIQTGRRTGAIFYQKNSAIYATDPATNISRQIATLPDVKGAMLSISTVNSDETVLAGSYTSGEAGGRNAGERRPRAAPGAANYMGGDNLPDKGQMMERRLAARLPMVLFTLNVTTGEYKEILHTTDWIDHFQFSPTDPTLLMYAHEGPWHKIDRIWLTRIDGSMPPTLIHQRTMKMEIAGHEFWGADGQWIWYDLQTPRSEVFWVAGYNVKTGRRIWYHLERDQWSVHFNVSPDGALFSGDGGSEDKNVAHAKDGKWLYLFHPRLVADLQTPPNQGDMIQIGTFDYERLVNLKQHDYVLEPNATFTPDMKWLVFRSNMNGSVQVYAVELAKARPGPATLPPAPPIPPGVIDSPHTPSPR